MSARRRETAGYGVQRRITERPAIEGQLDTWCNLGKLRETAQISFGLLQVAGSCCPDQPAPFEREQTADHDGPYLQARQDCDAVRHCEDQGMGARLRARTTARDRAADGLDELGRYAPAGPAPLRHTGGGDRVLRAPRHCLSSLRAQA